MKFRTNLGIPRTVAESGEASYLFVLNLSPLGFGHLPCCPQLDFIVELCRMALDENPHSFGDSPHSCLVWRSQLLIRFEFEPPWFRALALLPQLDFIVELCRMGLDENPHSFGDSPHSCLVWRSQLLIRFEFEPPRFRALALLLPTRFYCGTMQNGTGWKSALVWGFSAQLPCLEKPVTYLFWIWAPSVLTTCPVAPN